MTQLNFHCVKIIAEFALYCPKDYEPVKAFVELQKMGKHNDIQMTFDNIGLEDEHFNMLEFMTYTQPQIAQAIATKYIDKYMWYMARERKDYWYTNYGEMNMSKGCFEDFVFDQERKKEKQKNKAALEKYILEQERIHELNQLVSRMSVKEAGRNLKQSLAKNRNKYMESLISDDI